MHQISAPIKRREKDKKICACAKKVVTLQRELEEYINEPVYDLYGLTESEKEIIRKA